MSRNSKRHVHKYYHADLLFGKLWACALENCSHHMPQHYEGLLNGKASICWSCGSSFRLNMENMKNDRPICESCKLGMKDDDIELPLSDAMKLRIADSNK